MFLTVFQTLMVIVETSTDRFSCAAARFEIRFSFPHNVLQEKSVTKASAICSIEGVIRIELFSLHDRYFIFHGEK